MRSGSGQRTGRRRGSRRVRPLHVLLLTRQLEVMLRAGIPIQQALFSLRMQPDNPALGRVVDQIVRRIEAGHWLSEALAAHPTVFPRIVCSMVKVGEATGRLGEALARTSDWLERDLQTTRRVQAALTYPAFILTLTSVLTLAVFWTVLPAFLDLFQAVDVPLPWPTVLVLALARLAGQPLFWVLAAGAAAAATHWARERLREDAARQWAWRWLLRTPGLGRLLQVGSLARFCSALEMLQGCGVDLLTALPLAGQACGDPLLAQDAREAVRSVTEGASLSQHMTARPALYPGAVVHLTHAGEESGALHEMNRILASYYEEEAACRVETLRVLLEPLLLTLVAFVVAFIAFAIFLPLSRYIADLGVR